MPLLTPSQIHQVLKHEKRASAERSIDEQLDDASLSTEEILMNLGSIMRGGDTDAVKVRAMEMALRLHGHLQSKSEAPDVSVQIVIQDGDFSGMNPILIPRNT